MEGLNFGQTAKISIKKGLKVFGDSSYQVFCKETKQLHYQKIPIPVDPTKLSCGSISDALKYLMFLKMNSDGSTKGHGCPNGQIQHSHKSK